jgi:hypothetical protein
MTGILKGLSTVQGYVPVGLSTAQIQAISPSQAINLSSLQKSYSSSGSIFGEEQSAYGSHIKKYSILESTEDLLVLAATLKRIREKQSMHHIHSVLDSNLLEYITPEDRQEATEIQDYYSKKIMLWKLKGSHLSKFRNDLNEMIHGDPKKFREEMIGIAYYLPSFKEYDVVLDEVRCDVKNVPTERVDKIKFGTRLLTPMKKMHRKTKRTNAFHYWFKDESNYAVFLGIDAGNPLLQVWNHLFETKDLLSMKGTFYVQKRDDFEYYSVKNYELTNI